MLSPSRPGCLPLGQPSPPQPGLPRGPHPMSQGTGVDVFAAQPGPVNTTLCESSQVAEERGCLPARLPARGGPPRVNQPPGRPRTLPPWPDGKNAAWRPATWFNNTFARLFGMSPRRGAIPLIYACAAPELDGGRDGARLPTLPLAISSALAPPSTLRPVPAAHIAGHSGAYISYPYAGVLSSYILGTSHWTPLNPRYHSKRNRRQATGLPGAYQWAEEGQMRDAEGLRLCCAACWLLQHMSASK